MTAQIYHVFFWLFTTNYLGPAQLLVAEAYWEDLGIQRRPNLRGLSQKLGVTTGGTSFPGHLNVEMMWWFSGFWAPISWDCPKGPSDFMGLLRQPYYSNRGFSRGFGHGVWLRPQSGWAICWRCSLQRSIFHGQTGMWVLLRMWKPNNPANLIQLIQVGHVYCQKTSCFVWII